MSFTNTCKAFTIASFYFQTCEELMNTSKDLRPLNSYVEWVGTKTDETMLERETFLCTAIGSGTSGLKKYTTSKI